MITAPVLLNGSRHPGHHPASGLDEYRGKVTDFLVKGESGKPMSGIYQCDQSSVSYLKWERAEGALLNPEAWFTPEAVGDVWSSISDFSKSTYATGAQDFGKLLPVAMTMPSKETKPWLRFEGKVAIVTGGASGLGRCYALALARLGAAVVVNDLQDPADTVEEIRRAGGQAIAVAASVLQADTIIKQALWIYGHIDILINNAGFLRDKSFTNMDEKTWQAVIDVHLNGTYEMTSSVWPLFVRQSHGRIVNTSSTSGIYGNFGQANYSAAVSLFEIFLPLNF